MVFSSLVFILVFLPLVFIPYYFYNYMVVKIFKKNNLNISNYYLLLVSMFFYFWGESYYIFCILASVLLDYGVSLMIPDKDSDKKNLKTIRLSLLSISLLGNLGLLFYFKYSLFTFEMVNMHLFEVNLDMFKEILLPLGISFYTFQSMSYTIDVFLGKIKPTKNIANFCFYVSFFPQLVAGPIVRYTEIEDDINDRVIKPDDVVKGINRFIIGLAKKVLIADKLGILVDQLYLIPNNELSFQLAWLAAIAWYFQIYFDFSGYSDMAIGLAKMLGFNFPENFKTPYRSKNITEFWRTWHMTLSRWFRDYLYIPLGGNKRGVYRTYINLFLVFFLCGLWHGASVVFIVWGLFHGFFLVLERMLKNKFQYIPRGIIGLIYTNLIIIIGWVLFRSDSIDQSLAILNNMFLPYTLENDVHAKTIHYYFTNSIIITLILAFIFSFIKTEFLNKNIIVNFLSPIFYILLLVISMSYLAGNLYSPFIYFRF